MASSANGRSQSQQLTKMELHSLLIAGWHRGIIRHGKGGWLDKLDITPPALDKQLTGSMPGLEVIDKALGHEPTVLDDWLAAKGKRIVDVEPADETARLKLLVAQINLKLEEYAHPDSPGGVETAHTEYLDGEAMMRELHAASGRWIERCNSIRNPSLRSVA